MSEQPESTREQSYGGHGYPYLRCSMCGALKLRGIHSSTYVLELTAKVFALEAERDRLLAERSLLLHDADEIHAIESANSNLQGELHALRRKVQYLIDWANKWGHLPEHYFTFADGDTWWATGHHPWENIT